jgi:hypothetical protein
VVPWDTQRVTVQVPAHAKGQLLYTLERGNHTIKFAMFHTDHDSRMNSRNVGASKNDGMCFRATLALCPPCTQTPGDDDAHYAGAIAS